MSGNLFTSAVIQNEADTRITMSSAIETIAASTAMEKHGSNTVEQPSLEQLLGLVEQKAQNEQWSQADEQGHRNLIQQQH